ncbi:flagellar biosynthetic protein FliO [Lysinibacillus telephonicus]|uniref:flagellar biosynthetic protein FliO n=1 Tax=Lysinibacillus telephonicus TaxID=1714840 RepID=UPI0037D2CAAA
MKFKLFVTIRLVIALLFTLLMMTPTDTTLASQKSPMVSDECLKNPDSCPETLPAADQEKSDSAAVGLGPWDYIKMLFALIFVLALLLFVLKFINKKSMNYQQNSLVRNIGGISVGAQKSIQLLHIGDKLYIVGVGDNVQLIKEINDPDEVQQLVAFYNEKQSFGATTPYILELLKKLKPNQIESESKQDDSNFGDIFNKRLLDIKKERQHELEKWKEKEKDK